MTELPTDPEQLAEAIDGLRIKPRRIRESYAMGPVDSLLDRLAVAVREGQPLAPLLEVELPRVKIREGYDIEQVDEFLAALRARD